MTWYYVANGAQAGPVDDAALQSLAAAGTVTPQTLVWRSGMDNWAPLASVFNALAAMAVPAATSQCLQCKRYFPPAQTIPLAGGQVCGACKALVLQRIREGQSPQFADRKYAGFWIRLVARMIDNTITSVISYIFQVPLLIITAGMGAGGRPNLPLIMSAGAFAVICALAATGYYEAWFLKNKSATPGKMILGLKVIRARGGDISWGLAGGRYFAYLLGGLTLYFGYMMAGWDDEKRALHDRICDTRVVAGS